MFLSIILPELMTSELEPVTGILSQKGPHTVTVTVLQLHNYYVIVMYVFILFQQFLSPYYVPVILLGTGITKRKSQPALKEITS